MKKSAPQSSPAADPYADLAKWFERFERFGFACGGLLFVGLHGLFWGWVTFGFGFGDGDGPDIFLAFWFSAHIAALIACAAVVGMNWPSREQWRDMWQDLLAPREKTPDYSRVKNELTYVRGNYLPGDLVPKSADEIAIRKTARWAIILFHIIFIGGALFALDAGKDYAPPLWLSVAMIVIGFTGLVLVARLRDLAERVQGDLDRADALARSRSKPKKPAVIAG